MEKIKQLIAQYGPLALVIYFVIFGLTMAGFSLAIASGVDVESAASGVGTIGAAYIATKLTQPIRIAGTLLLTPVVARGLQYFKRGGPQPPAAG